LFSPEKLLPRAFAIDTNPDLSYLEVDWAEKPNKQVGGANCSLTSQSQPFYFLKKSKKLERLSKGRIKN
jgi:hypothetical protein